MFVSKRNFQKESTAHVNKFEFTCFRYLIGVLCCAGHCFPNLSSFSLFLFRTHQLTFFLTQWSQTSTTMSLQKLGQIKQSACWMSFECGMHLLLTWCCISRISHSKHNFTLNHKPNVCCKSRVNVIQLPFDFDCAAPELCWAQLCVWFVAYSTRSTEYLLCGSYLRALTNIIAWGINNDAHFL